MEPKCIYASAPDSTATEIYEETFESFASHFDVRARFEGSDNDDVLARKNQTRRIVNRFESELDAHIIAKRAELRAELALLCDELEID